MKFSSGFLPAFMKHFTLTPSFSLLFLLQCGGNDKSIGWIALVQRYNMPKHVLEQRKEVTSKEDAEKIVKRSHKTENGHSPSDADAKQLVVYMGESTIDHVPTEHVRCCGHQVTWLCPTYLCKCTKKSLEVYLFWF